MTAETKTPGGAWAAQVPDFARRIGEAARAERVVLFGSGARGDMREHSDLDFLAVISDAMPDEKATEASRFCAWAVGADGNQGKQGRQGERPEAAPHHRCPSALGGGIRNLSLHRISPSGLCFVNAVAQ